VLGRPDVAVKGELNVLAAGNRAALATVQPVLDAIGRKTWTFGEQPHKANVAKLSANFMIAATIELLAEVFAFTEKSGLDPKVFFEMATNTLFAAPVFRTYGGLIRTELRAGETKLTLGSKDVRWTQLARPWRCCPRKCVADNSRCHRWSG
jgi:3-hydroxyisobutyrate dehydrogenase-like beta-hydroxyacid dehydrogenase